MSRPTSRPDPDELAGIKLCESYKREYGTDFRSVMPTNLYGPNDNFDRKTSHVLPALLRKFHEAKVAGSETARRLHGFKTRLESTHRIERRDRIDLPLVPRPVVIFSILAMPI